VLAADPLIASNLIYSAGMFQTEPQFSSLQAGSSTSETLVSNSSSSSNYIPEGSSRIESCTVKSLSSFESFELVCTSYAFLYDYFIGTISFSLSRFIVLSATVTFAFLGATRTRRLRASLMRTTLSRPSRRLLLPGIWRRRRV
jgi:hypothetical protein